MGNLVLLDAPSNLGLRPPAEGVVPGCYKAPGALRDHGLLTWLGATDGGVRNAAGIADYTTALAGRLAKIRADGGFPVVLGGDCSIALAAMLTLRREGRFGVVYFDGHDDFRHLGNSDHVASVGGEALAVVTGRGAPELADVGGLGPYVRDDDVLVLGVRAEESGDAREIFAPLDGFWIHLDIDTLDPAFVSAVDSPDPGGLDPDKLVELLRGLLAIPGAAGLELTIFDPDLDPDGTQAALVTDCPVHALEGTR